ncbi:MAG: histidine kinase [Bacteroidales bacterium]
MKVNHQMITRKNPVLLHAAIWAGYYLLLFWLQAEHRTTGYAFLHTTVNVALQAGVFYLNYHVLLPRYLEQKKHLQYIIAVVAVLAVGIIILFYMDQSWFRAEWHRAARLNDWSKFRRNMRGGGPPPVPPRWDRPFQVMYVWREVFVNGFFLMIALFVSSLIRNSQTIRRRQEEALVLQQRASEAEVKFLKSQINPHFLFNTLNTIYALSRQKSEMTPDAVMQLSEMLRYVIYDSKSDRVPVSKEFDYIRHFVALNMLRTESTEQVDLKIEAGNQEVMIAPMILIPFIENSFKHSGFPVFSETRISIEIGVKSRLLNMEVRNTIPGSEVRKDKETGIGLENVKKRLNLIYPGKYILQHGPEGGYYRVQLILDLNEA